MGGILTCEGSMMGVLYETTEQAISKSLKQDETNAQALQWGTTRFNRLDLSALVQRGTKKIPPRNDHWFRKRAEEPMA